MHTIAERQKAWTDLTDAPEVVEQARRAAAERIDLIKNTGMYSEDHKRQLIAEQREALEAIGREQLARAKAARDRLLADSRELDTQGGGDTTAQLLAETRQGRAWDRVRAQLDGGRHWSTLVDEAVQARDAASIRALAAELPAYMKAAGGRDAEQLDVQQLAEHLDVATYRVLGDDQGPGTAARLRLHAATRYPLAQQVIESAVLGSDMTRAMSISYARKDAERIEARLDGRSGDDAA